jgi:putative ABC transport system substrate-binding protein
MLLLLGALLPSAVAAAATDVLILESSTARPYQAARESLLRALPKDLRVDQLLLDSEEPARDAERVGALGARVLVTLGTQATDWALTYTRVTPIVFAMVLHPVQSNFVRSFHAPGDRITGAALDIPPEVQLRTLREVLGVRRVGVLYDPAETGMLIEAARKAARRSGTELVAVPVSEPGKLEEALEKLNGRVEALWSVPDRTVFGRGAVEKVLLYTLREKIPFMGLSEQYVRAGALLALTVSYTENGRQAAGQVQEILDGKQAPTLPVARPQSIEVVFNAHIAHRLKRRVPQGARIIPAGFAR